MLKQVVHISTNALYSVNLGSYRRKIMLRSAKFTPDVIAQLFLGGFQRPANCEAEVSTAILTAAEPPVSQPMHQTMSRSDYDEICDEQPGAAVNALASYLGDVRFEFRTGNRLSMSVFFLRPCRQMSV